MAVSKRQIKQKEKVTNGIAINKNPDAYYERHPVWAFHKRDKNKWTISEASLWYEILPKLEQWETQTWKEILVLAEKQNHPVRVEDLNKFATDRLEELHIETEAVISLRLSATVRLYGYIVDSAFNILWYDCNHGDNYTCVCRSKKRRT